MRQTILKEEQGINQWQHGAPGINDIKEKTRNIICL